MGSAAASKLAEGVKEASPAALQESAKDLSGEERSRIMSAIAILELAGGYAGSASNGDWGDYSIRVQVMQDATATVSESACFFRDSPSEETTHKGHVQRDRRYSDLHRQGLEVSKLGDSRFEKSVSRSFEY